MATVDLELNADFKKATSDIAKFSKDSSKSLEGLKTGFRALAAAAGAVAGAFAVKKVVDAAAKQEQAVRSLNTALALTGDFTEENSKAFQDFASELQKNSTIGDEVSLSMVGLAKSMGATNEQTEKIIQAAADMSAVTGETLEASVRNLTKTLGGLKGELGETQPEIRGLTEDQLKNGEAIDILAQKYRGTAKELTKTFAGAMTQTQNAFGDLLEEIGFLVTNNPVVIEAIHLMSDSFNQLGALVKANRKEIIDFAIDAIAGLVKGIAFLIKRMGEAIALFTNFEAVIDLAFLKLGEGAKFVLDLVPGFDDLKASVNEFTNAARDGFVESADKLIETNDKFIETADSVDLFAERLKELKKEGKDSNKTLVTLSKTNKKLAIDTQKAATAAKTAGSKEVPFAQQSFLGGSVTGGGLLKGAGALASGIAGGAQGANQLFAQGAAALADKILPGAGAVAGPIAQLLAAGPEAAKAQAEAFIDQIPVIIDNVVEALPVLIETLAANSDKIIIALAEASPKVAEAIAIEVPLALARSLPPALGRILTAFVEGVEFNFARLFGDFDKTVSQIPQKLANGITQAFNGLFQGIVTDGLPALIAGLTSGLTSFFISVGQSIGQGILEPIREFFNNLELPGLGNISGGGGGGGGVVGEIVNFASDTLESVNPFNLTGQEQAQPQEVVIKIGEEELARVLLNLSRRGFRT